MSTRNHQASAADDAAARWEALAAARDDAVRLVSWHAAGRFDAEDCVHEAMLRLSRRPLETVEPARLRALLARAAVCVAIDGHRRSGTLQRLLPRLLQPDTTATPEEIVADRSEARWLATGLPELGALERKALVQSAAGSSIDEIAAALGVEYKAAENALGRARRKLRLRATVVTVGIAALLRRLRQAEDHGAALSASALAAVALLTMPAPTLVAAAGPAPQPRIAVVVPVQPAVAVQPAPRARIVFGVAPQRVVHQAPPPRPTPMSQPSPSPSPTMLPNCGGHVDRGVWAPALDPVYSAVICFTSVQRDLNG